MGYIYVITNTKNNKKYVGQTTNTIQQRWHEHKIKATSGDKNYLLYQAMRRAGIRYFKISELEQCDDSLLNDREIWWIKKLGTYGNGYNMNEGGDSMLYDKPTDKEIEDWWKRFVLGESVSSISKTTKFHRPTITKYLSKHKEYKRMAKLRMYGVCVPRPYLLDNRVIEEYDKHGNYIGEIDLKNAKMRTEYKNAIYDVCLGKRKWFSHHIFKFKE